MPVRALIVAIEEYNQMGSGFSRELPGTRQSALQFRQWLVENKFGGNEDEAAKHIQFLCDDPSLEGATSGASAGEFQNAVLKLRKEGQDSTPELFFFFSGHGFSVRERQVRRPADTLVFADFVDPEIATACLGLEPIRQYLWMCMGPGEHFLFLDACRNEFEEGRVVPANLALKFDHSRLQRPQQYTLYSTSRGSVASALSGFAGHLMKGLSGAGRAKAWRDAEGDMAVFFKSLTKYVQGSLRSQEADAEIGSGDGILLTLDPTPELECRIKVENAGSSDRFEVKVSNSRRQTLGEFQFSGSEHSLRRVPDFYFFDVSHASAEVVPVDNHPVEVYDDCSLTFEMKPLPSRSGRGREAVRSQKEQLSRARGAPPQGPGGGLLGGLSLGESDAEPPPPPDDIPLAMPSRKRSAQPRGSWLTVRGAPRSQIEVRNLQFSTLYSAGEEFSKKLPPGEYLIEMKDSEGRAIRSREMELEPGKTQVMRFRPEDRAPLTKELRARFGKPGSRWWVEFSESVGPLLHDDMGVWLSILGASRIVSRPQDASKLADLPLADFGDCRPGAAPAYVLTDLPDAQEGLRLGVSRPGRGADKPDWQHPEAVAGLPGLCHLRIDDVEGPWLLSLHQPPAQPTTVLLHGLPNRAVLVVLTQDDRAGLDVRHFLLPLDPLVDSLDAAVREKLHTNQLAMVSLLAESQRRLAQRQEIVPREASSWAGDYADLLDGLWLDPVFSLLAAYDLVRRGASTDRLVPLIEALQEAYPQFPDVAVLARLAGQSADGVSGCPLFLEGLLALPDYQVRLDLPESRLDFKGPWTAWQNAVSTGDTQERSSSLAAPAD